MKPKIIILAIVILAFGFGFLQHSRLTGLKETAARLRLSAKETRPNGPSHRNESPAEPMVRKSTREADSPVVSEHMAAIIARFRLSSAIAEKWRNPATRTPEVTAALKDSMKRETKETWPHFAALNHRQVSELIEKLENDPEISSLDKPQIGQVCVERLSETNAAEALQLILKIKDLPESDRYLNQAFSRCVAENPGEAIRWFEEQSQTGHPLTQSPGMLQSMMLAEARHDPARAVTRISSKETAANAGSLELLGSKIASTLRDAGEHRAFLAALRRAEGTPPALVKLRTQYIANLAREMQGWPVEDATALMASEFSPGEKLTASQLVSSGGLPDAGQWAAWFSSVDAPADKQHPLVEFVSSWSQSDPEAAADWLELTSPSDLRGRAILAYASLSGDSDPARTARMLVSVPASQERDQLLDRLLAQWKTLDRPAALAFSAENQLSE